METGLFAEREATPRITFFFRCTIGRMGNTRLRLWKLVHGFREPVAGTLRVTAVEWGRAGSSQIKLIGVLSAPGLAPRPLSRDVRNLSGRHITEGVDLPVMVDLARPDKLRILWNQVPSLAQYQAQQQIRDMQQAAETAARMASGPPFGGANPIDAGRPGQGQFGTAQFGAAQFGTAQFGQGQFDAAQFGTGPFDAGRFNAGFGGSTSFSAGPDFTGTPVGSLPDNLASAVSAAIAQAFGGHAQGGWTESHVHVEIMDGASGGPIVNGRPGTAIVRAARDVVLPPMMAGMVPGGLVDLVLEVTSPESPAPYTAHTRLAFSTPQRRAMLSTPGTQLPVRIDPATPTHVVIDTSELKFDVPEF
jgi:hypothetical protein